MARPLRIEYPGAWYHITSRGNAQAELYRDDSDRGIFIKILKESLETYGVEMHCYVLMRNHFHLLLMTPLGNVSRFMQRLNTAYTVYFNRRHHRVGHLFQGRFKAILIDADSYLLELSRYIHLNPVRTDYFEDKSLKEKIEYLTSYRWSSFRYYAGLEKAPDFLRIGVVLSLFGGGLKIAQRRYREFVLEGLRIDLPNPMKDRKGRLVLGSPDFEKWVYATFIDQQRGQKEFTRLDESLPEISFGQILQTVSDEFGVPAQDLIRKRSRHAIARRILVELCCRYLVRKDSLRDIGGRLGGISVSGLGRSRQHLKESMERDGCLKKRFETIRRKILSQ